MPAGSKGLCHLAKCHNRQGVPQHFKKGYTVTTTDLQIIFLLPSQGTTDE